MNMAALTQPVTYRLADSFGRHPDKLALHTPRGSLDYAALEGLVVAAQRELQSCGLPENRLVGVLTGDAHLCYVSILAILACGCAYVPINHRNPVDRNRIIIADAGLELVLSHREHPPLDEADESVRVVRTDALQSADSPLQVEAVEPSDLAYLFYTSGSTGRPKGVPISHRNLGAYMSVMLDSSQYEFGAQDRFLQMFDLTFDLSVTSFLTPLCVGGTCYVIPEQGIVSVNVIAALRDHDVTVALLVPSVLFYLQRYFEEIRLPAMRYSLFCGEALPEALVSDWAACVPNARIQNLYGPTEATIACLRYDWSADSPVPSSDNGIVAIGKPFPGMEAFVVGDDGEALAPGEKGELCLAGPQVTDCYWQDTVRTEQAFLPHGGQGGLAYRTGDVCYLNDNQDFIYCGRTDHQVKIDGFRVELGEIEHHAREAAQGVNAAVTATAAADGGVDLTLFLERATVDIGTVRDFLASRLPPHMQPARIENLEQLPLNVNGKVDRGALAARAIGNG